MINYGKQTITEEDLDAVKEVLNSDFLTQGPMVPRFEAALAKTVNAQFGVAVNSATSALHIACAALGVGRNDTVWTVPNTFVASANCALYCNAEIDFVDIDPKTWNMSVEKLSEKLIRAAANGKLPKVIIPVHFSGQPTEQDKIYDLASAYNIKIIEDASHSIGARFLDEDVGSCKWSDITVFSFHPVKIITTGEGGMAVTNDFELANKMKMLRSHGVTRDPDFLEKNNAEPWYYEQQMLGWNYRMTDIAAGLGLSQLNRLANYVSIRNKLATRYFELISDLPLELPTVIPECLSSYHLFVIVVKENQRHNIFMRMRELGIGVNVHYLPVHLQPFFQKKGFARGMFPIAEHYGECAITLPLHANLTYEEQNNVVDSLRHVTSL